MLGHGSGRSRAVDAVMPWPSTFRLVHSAACCPGPTGAVAGCPAGGGVSGEAAAAGVRTRLVLYPQLVEQDTKRRCSLVVADPFGRQVDAERVDQRDPWHVLHDLPVDVLPGVVSRGSVGGLQCGCAGDLAVDLPVAEAGRGHVEGLAGLV